MDSYVFLGPQNAGKTTIGRAFAPYVGLPFTDIDERITLGKETTLRYIARHSWPTFRQKETREILAVAGLAQDEPVVLSLGGGAIASRHEQLREINKHTIRRMQGPKIYLLPSEDQEESARILAERSALKSYHQIVEELKERDPHYREVRTHTVYTEGKTIDQIVEELLDITPAQI